jgi:hypothetical protein
MKNRLTIYNSTTMAIFLIATVAVVLAELIAIYVIEAIEAANTTSESRDKGARGELMSDGKHNGNGGGEICPTCGG